MKARTFYSCASVRYVLYICSAFLAVVAGAVGIFVDPSCFYLLFASLGFILGSLPFMLAKIRVTDNEILISYPFIKDCYKRTELKEIFIARDTMVLCFYGCAWGLGASTANPSFLDYLKMCRQNPQIRCCSLEYNKKLVAELSKIFYGKIIKNGKIINHP